MKKQLLIAAVAATMTSVAIADISIAGAMKANYTNVDGATSVAADNAVTTETDLVVTGKSGATTVVYSITVDQDSGDNAAQSKDTMQVEKTYMTTSIGDVNLKVGRYNGGDNNLTATTGYSNGNYSASTTMGGVKVTVDGDDQEATTDVTVGGTFGGVTASFHADQNEDEIKLSGSVAGVDLSYHNFASDTANEDLTAITASTEVNGMTVTVVSVEVDSGANENGEDFFDIATLTDNGDDLMGVELATSIAGNTVKFKHIALDATVAANDVDINKITVTRALAAGTTFEGTYTMKEDTSVDTDTLDLELAVKF